MLLRAERRAVATVTERSVETVISASERVVGAADPSDMVRHARLLGQATAHLITNIKVPAPSPLTSIYLSRYLGLTENQCDTVFAPSEDTGSS